MYAICFIIMSQFFGHESQNENKPKINLIRGIILLSCLKVCKRRQMPPCDNKRPFSDVIKINAANYVST